jgi:tRNA A37 threonylcarbamoyladenosine synthetase subunit TsaC/SUA5/YrdC
MSGTAQAVTDAGGVQAASAAGADAVLDAMQAGGVAILPLDVAYAVIGTTETAIRTIFAAKGRSYEKPSGMFATWQMSREIHLMDADHNAIAQVIVEEYDLPFSIVAPFRADHPLLRAVDPFVLANSSKAGTLDMLINAGGWHDAVARRATARGIVVFGSSANRSLTVRAAAAIAIDGGTSRYANDEGKSSTIVDFRGFRLIRRGVCCDRLIAIFKDRFGITLTD